ncbi:hypothetical protein [Winogradskyella jejuensis]|uniref:Glucosyl transferase GtrII n=1 Tax=Winogradskyella jejuensis TaxID=1089305 RepID=A0A1M5RGW7_9FLAO|nr:hypothetical protein [Winogradskyella jejuensis]SHH25386.1 hypothetical protein SAMN05444148_1582 [Winogradskyella jejuensis]
MTVKTKRLKASLLFFCFAFIVCLGLNYQIFYDYAFLDTNELIYTASRNNDFHNIFIENGRPLLGWWSEYLYGHVFTKISDLKWARFFTLLICVLFSTQVFRFLLNIGLKIYESAIFSILILALPSFTVYYGWSATAQIPLLLIVNFYAGELLLRALTKRKVISLDTIIAALIVLVSLFMYQSVVMMFIVPFLITTIKTNNYNVKRWWYIIIFTLFCFIVYYMSFKIIAELNNLETANRTALNILDIPKKVIKFYLFELSILLKNSGFLIISIISLLLGLIGSIGFVYRQSIDSKSLLFTISFILALPFSYAPNILSGQDYFSLRTIATTAVIVLFYQFWFLRYLSIKYLKLKKVLLLLPIVFLFFSMYNQSNYVAGLQHKEYNVVKNVFHNVDIKNKSEIVIIIPEYGFLQKHGYLKNGFSDEFGNLSSVKEWSSPHLFAQIKWEQLDTNDNTISPFPPENVIIQTKDTLQERNDLKVINLIEYFHKAFE